MKLCYSRAAQFCFVPRPCVSLLSFLFFTPPPECWPLLTICLVTPTTFFAGHKCERFPANSNKEGLQVNVKPHLNTTCSAAECVSERVSVSPAGFLSLFFSDSLNSCAYFGINSQSGQDVAELGLGAFPAALKATDTETKVLGFAFLLPVQPQWVVPQCASDRLSSKRERSTFLMLHTSTWILFSTQYTVLAFWPFTVFEIWLVFLFFLQRKKKQYLSRASINGVRNKLSITIKHVFI